MATPAWTTPRSTVRISVRPYLHRVPNSTKTISPIRLLHQRRQYQMRPPPICPWNSNHRHKRHRISYRQHSWDSNPLRVPRFYRISSTPRRSVLCGSLSLATERVLHFYFDQPTNSKHFFSTRTSTKYGGGRGGDAEWRNRRTRW